jgi:sugar lactone lactonase YvrE
MRPIRRLAPIAAVLVLALAMPASAAPPPPDRIPLPDGFQPEGIAMGGRHFWVGSLSTGALFRAEARTGEGSVVVEGEEGRSAAGLSVHRGKVFVAGGETGEAYVYSASTGEEIATYTLTEAPTFVNDVVATDRAAWFTDSVNPVLYRVPLSRRGKPGGPRDVETIPLQGVRYREGFNVNGIDATPNGRRLIVVQSNTGLLFTVSAATGRAHRIDLGGRRVRNGDGLLLDGTTLFVVQNFDNRIAVVELARGLGSGEVVERVGHEAFDIPTTVAQRRGFLYVVNARFTTPPTPTTEYWVTVLPKP